MSSSRKHADNDYFKGEQQTQLRIQSMYNNQFNRSRDCVDELIRIMKKHVEDYEKDCQNIRKELIQVKTTISEINNMEL